jgi:hypothetical protein
MTTLATLSLLRDQFSERAFNLRSRTVRDCRKHTSERLTLLREQEPWQARLGTGVTSCGPCGCGIVVGSVYAGGVG